MKKGIKILLSALLLFFGIVVFAFNTSESPKKIKIKITAKLHKQTEDCKRAFGICDVNIDIDWERLAGVPGEAELDGNTLTLNFTRDIVGSDPSLARENTSVMTITEEDALSLSPATAERLGQSSINIKPGIYKVDYSTNRFGTVIFNVEVTK
ncbi:MAG: hypothetical protein WKF35_06210 [Ferruginibacter sp.]